MLNVIQAIQFLGEALVREPILILRRREIQAAWLGSRMHGLHGLGCMLHENEWGA